MKKIFRLGTRGSPLALIQAEMVRTAILQNTPSVIEEYNVELVPIRTTGDWQPEMAERTMQELGANKGLFTKEIDEALLNGQIDAATHSMKDTGTVLPDQFSLIAMLERADPRDAFLCPAYNSLAELPSGATVGTASLRRKAQILAYRSDLKIIPLRGNVETRLKKLADGIADATLLAQSGLNRMGLSQRVTKTLDTNIMLPAVGQGAIGVVVRRDNEVARRLVAPLNHLPTSVCVMSERAMLSVLDGSCRTPIAGFARLASDAILVLEGLAARPDGTGLLRLQKSGKISDAVQIGTELGEEIKSRLPSDFFTV